MNPFFITTLIGIVVAVLSLGNIAPSVSGQIQAKAVEVGIGREAALVRQIIRFKGVTGAFPSTVGDLVSADYWSAADNDNGLGGAYAFSVEPAKNIIVITTNIPDAGRRAQYLASFKHSFLPKDLGAGVVSTTHVIPSPKGNGSPTPTSSAIPVGSVAPDAATNAYWYDTSSGSSAILKVSDGASWVLATMGSGGIPAPTSGNIVSGVSALPSVAETGDVRYVYSAESDALIVYVFYDGAWVPYTGSNDSINLPARFNIAGSLRLRAAASAGLSTNLSAPTDQRKFTFSAWVKLSALATDRCLLSADFAAVGGLNRICFNQTGNLAVYFEGPSGTQKGGWVTMAKLVDPTSWYHVVVSSDSTQSAMANMVKFEVNGVALPTTVYTYSTSGVAQNTSWWINSPRAHQIGYSAVNGLRFDGLLAEVNFIDGAALSASSFGGLVGYTGQWMPKAYAGPYGNNGFRLAFADASSPSALGADSSGRGRHWTPAGVSLLAGASYDAFADSPTNNHASWNSLDSRLNLPTFANLRAGHNPGEATRASVFVSSGKWYWEWRHEVGVNGNAIGVANNAAPLTSAPGQTAHGYSYGQPGAKNHAGSAQPYGAAYGPGDVIGVALDLDRGLIFFSKNGVWQAGGDPASGVAPAFSGLNGSFAPMFGVDPAASQGAGGFANFGQQPFAFSPPAGFKAISTANLRVADPSRSGAFTGNSLVDGPFVWLGASPETLSINGNAVTFGVHADRTAGGFKLRTNAAAYNSSGTNVWSATYLSPSTKSSFKHQLAK